MKAPYIATTKQGYYLSVFRNPAVALKEMDENGPDGPQTLRSLIAALASE